MMTKPARTIKDAALLHGMTAKELSDMVDAHPGVKKLLGIRVEIKGVAEVRRKDGTIKQEHLA